MLGAAISLDPEPVQEKMSVQPVPSTPVSAVNAPKASPDVKREEKRIAVPAPPSAGSTGTVDRAAIARVVENVLASQGIARGSGAPTTIPAMPAVPIVKELSSPSSIASEIADRFFGSSEKLKAETADVSSVASSVTTKPAEASIPPTPASDTRKKSEPAAKIATEIHVFVSENDVRRAMTRSEKIFIGRKTILTPSARDLGLEHEVFVETEAGSIR
jgi:hypothetical protein